MRVINIHKRKLQQPKPRIAELFKTLATKDDKVWPQEIWPPMRFKNGLKVGSKGGHGIVRYTIVDYIEGESIVFQFSKPEGFIGTHKLYINEIENNETEILHEINMYTSTVKATFLWVFVVRWLHDALLEDAFDKVESQFSTNFKKKKHIIWVKFLRYIFKSKKANLKPVSN